MVAPFVLRPPQKIMGFETPSELCSFTVIVGVTRLRYFFKHAVLWYPPFPFLYVCAEPRPLQPVLLNTQFRPCNLYQNGLQLFEVLPISRCRRGSTRALLSQLYNVQLLTNHQLIPEGLIAHPRVLFLGTTHTPSQNKDILLNFIGPDLSLGFTDDV